MTMKKETSFERLLAGYRNAARLNGLGIEGLQSENDRLRQEMSLMRGSLSWRSTFFLRAVRSLSLGRMPDGRPLSALKIRISSLWMQGGAKAVLRVLLRRLRKRDESVRQDAGLAVYEQALKTPPENLRPQVLIIAEVTLRQCAKYRVWQKKDLLESLGWSVNVMDWRDISVAMSALQVCTRVIFYRVPGFDDVMKLVKEAHRLALGPYWEVDDLIFDAGEYLENGNIQSLPKEERDLLISGVALFRRCMLACGKGIASTSALAKAMRDAGLSDVSVLENALDRETLEITRNISLSQSGPRDRVWVSYGSGTNTHDEDFRQAETGLLAAMESEPRLCLRVIGQLQLADAFKVFGDRVEHLSELSYPEYLAALAETDIAIAPLEATVFNDCKSNIKFLEAACVRVVAVCSPRAAFCSVMRNGVNGILAETDAEWREAFLTLASDCGLRRRLADQAWTDVMERYAPERMAETQGKALFGEPVVAERPLRVLMANVYYAPRSFGGATIVVEELGDRLQKKGVEVGVLTSRPRLEGRGSENIRYRARGADVLSCVLPADENVVSALDNPYGAEQFSTWLTAFQPDVVHVHAAQWLGTGMLRACQEQGVPYVITLHDAWWLCDRQFMVQPNGRYCFQTRIDQQVCQMCLPHARYLPERHAVMQQVLEDAALLISPSEAHRQLYIANGVAPERIVVNRNGFRWPQRARKLRETGKCLRFGFVGGTEAVKGYPLLKTCMESLTRSDWELVLVDNKLNLGMRSIQPEAWNVRGVVTVLPAFSQKGLDEFYDQIDVLLFPSQWKESYGLTVREALARDVWVVTTGPGGQSEDVVAGVNGTILPIDGKAATFAEAIEDVLNRPDRLERYVNPFKDRLATYDVQAEELLGYLKAVVATA